MNLIKIESNVIRAKEGNEDDLLKLLNQFKPFIINGKDVIKAKNSRT